MTNNLYIVLLEYFDSKKGTKEASKVENNACRHAIMFLIPYLEERIYNCEPEYMPKYYELWEKAYYKKVGLESILQYVPFGQSQKDWKRAIIIHAYEDSAYPISVFFCQELSFQNIIK